METVNVLIDEASTSKSSKPVKQMPKSALSLTFETDQEVDDQDSSPALPSVIQAPKDSFTSPQPKDQLEREPSSIIKLNHRSEEHTSELQSP